MSLSVSLGLCLSVCGSLPVSLWVSACQSVGLCLSVCKSLPVCMSLSVSLGLCLSVFCGSLPVSLWVSACQSVGLCLSVCKSLPVCMSLSVSLWVSACQSVGLCLSVCVSTALGDTHIVKKTTATAPMVTKLQLITNATMYKVLHATLNIAQSVLSARVHCVVLKGTLSKAVCLFIKWDTHMRGYPGEVNRGTSTF
ncbi:uncharacterized protein LOC135097569 [Scylla paramamosain]|uniref:uncharacterized protein LOC135097569 n=1 Tax=Scylla paramamosain TaxID=85552 RepID=UPI0030827B86